MRACWEQGRFCRQKDFWALIWILVKGFKLSYDNKETILFTIDPYYGNLNETP